jgi:hypothetical protein
LEVSPPYWARSVVWHARCAVSGRGLSLAGLCCADCGISLIPIDDDLLSMEMHDAFKVRRGGEGVPGLVAEHAPACASAKCAMSTSQCHTLQLLQPLAASAPCIFFVFVSLPPPPPFAVHVSMCPLLCTCLCVLHLSLLCTCRSVLHLPSCARVWVSSTCPAQECYIEEDMTSLTYVARSIMELQRRFGVVPNLKAKGVLAMVSMSACPPLCPCPPPSPSLTPTPCVVLSSRVSVPHSGAYSLSQEPFLEGGCPSAYPNPLS